MAKNDQSTERRDAFKILQIDEESGGCTLWISKGILGPLGNQLKNTNDQRKGATILRKLGYVISSIGDVLYSQNKEQTQKTLDNFGFTHVYKEKTE